MILIMIAIGLYERNLWNGKGDMLSRIVISFLIGLLVIQFTYHALYSNIDQNQIEFNLSILIALLGILLLRSIFLTVSNHDLFKRRVLVLGVGRLASQIDNLWVNDKTTCSIVGYFPVNQYEKPLVPSGRIIKAKNAESLSDLANELAVDEIVVAIDDRRQNFPADEIMECKFKGISISNFLNFYEKQSGRIQLDGLRPSSVIYCSGFERSRFNQINKRVFDIAVSSFLLMLSWPIMLLAALAVWVESGGRGPILYRQKRVGLGGQPFDIIKIRSMRANAEHDGVARWAQLNDNRITRVGALLRKTRIDELPQLFNVFWGNMSFVGPRPERPEFVADLCEKIPFYSIRHIVKPGITGWAQICYPYGASVHDAYEKLQYDLYYIKNYSLLFDTLILLQTAHAVFWSKGAR
jgi:sugar transferase (PEP-CTERM system associated)